MRSRCFSKGGDAGHGDEEVVAAGEGEGDGVDFYLNGFYPIYE